MLVDTKLKSEFVIVDTSAFIRNASLQEIGEKIVTVPEVVNEIKSKRQLRRLVVLPYDLQIKEVFPENISHVAEFAKKTGDFPSLSSTDLKVLALTYQLEKENVGTDHLKTVPEVSRTVNYCNYSTITADNIAGFYKPKKGRKSNNSESSECSETSGIKNADNLVEPLENCGIYEDESDYLSAHSDLNDSDEFIETEEAVKEYKDKIKLAKNPINDGDNNKSTDDRNLKNDSDFVDDDLVSNVFVKVESSQESFDVSHELVSGSIQEKHKNEKKNYNTCGEVDEVGVGDNESEAEEDDDVDVDDDDDDEIGWITPSNVKRVKQEMDATNLEEKPVKVACLTMDFAMQNVLKQMGLNILALDGRVIKQMRTFILRCYACFKTTSIMTKVFCHHCGNKTLKKVAVSVDEEGNQKIHINLRKPLTARGKKFSLPKPTGGKHSNYPILSEDQPMPDQRPSRLARMKNNPLEPDYIAGFSPFLMRDVNSKSAMLGIPNKTKEMKYWMRRNPNESFGKKKKKK